MNNYSIYYPEYNIESVIERYTGYLERKKMEKRRKKTFGHMSMLGSLAGASNFNSERGKSIDLDVSPIQIKQVDYRTTITLKKKKTVIFEDHKDILKEETSD